MPTDDEVINGVFSNEALATLRGDMMRFAQLQLRDALAAEDAVQEALTAALAARDQYAGHARLKTWVFTILRNKIVDLLRERVRHPTQSFDAGFETGDDLDDVFDRRGFWRKGERPADWSHPEDELANGQFWHVLDDCLEHLPDNTAHVFMMREMLGLEISEICRELSITENNCGVILHRARMRLRLCLEENWFHGN